MNKTCTKCKISKPLSEYNLHSRGACGRHPKCKPCRAVDSHNRYLRVGANPHDSDQWRKLKYGLSKTEYEKLFANAGGKCGICRKETKLVVDHCHETGRIRGLLCGPCNQALGKFGDSVAGLMAAIKYLES